MSIADQIPTFNDEQLASLRANAVRLEATSEGNKRQTAADLVPLIRRGLEEAWSRGHLPTSRNIEDFRLTGFSLGWEAPGPYEAAIQIRNLSIKAYAVAPEL